MSGDKTDKRTALQGIVSNPVTRRQFAQGAMASGLWAAGMSLWGGASQANAQAITDADILNFALNLEYLEAEFYTVATTGQRISDIGIGVAGTGALGPTTGGRTVTFSESLTRELARQIAVDEQEHVRLIRGALGNAAVAKPAINLDALGLGFGNEQEFLILARAFEDLGMSAYAGAAPLIDSTQILAVSARIALTEAQHAGVVRYVVAQKNIIVSQVDGMDVPPLGSPAGRLFQVDGSGLSTVRTPSQVLAVGGPFFPSGVNGTIRS